MEFVTEIYVPEESSFPETVEIKRDVQDLLSIFHSLNDQVHHQHETITLISDQISESHVNLEKGNQDLKEASHLAETSFILYGGILGAVIGGPIGFLVGAKMAVFGSVAGSIVGFSATKFINSLK